MIIPKLEQKWSWVLSRISDTVAFHTASMSYIYKNNGWEADCLKVVDRMIVTAEELVTLLKGYREMIKDAN